MKKGLRKLSRHEQNLETSRKLQAVQTDLVRLRGSAELIDRCMANVRLHASSLQMHHRTMRNVNGLLDDVNRLRGGMYAIIGMFNHNQNILRQATGRTDLPKIEGVDIEVRKRTISLVAAFDAFDRTRQLLVEEVLELSRLAEEHEEGVQRLRGQAGSLDSELGRQVVALLDKQVMPIVKKAQDGSYILRDELRQLPAAQRKADGSLEFNDDEEVVFVNDAGRL